jgi:CHAT domain/NACHT domain
MGKLVIFQLPEGNFQVGFPCTVQIGNDEGNVENLTQITGKLPGNPEMPQKLNQEWRRVFNDGRIKPKKAVISNFSRTDLVDNFVDYLNTWLNSNDREWQKIRDILQQYLSKEEEIRVTIQTQNPILRRIPWQAWNLFAEDYPKAEISLSPTTFQSPGDLPISQLKKVRILAVLGENTVVDGSPGIDIQFDQQELERLKQQGAFLKFLKQPSSQELRECLWEEEGWHIFFFAGHSFSDEDAKIGRIILNECENGLQISELKEALKKAISRGLQLAIFNSCDGLGLANQLAELNIRQMIVMREPVPDAIAKAFLKHFLTALACNNKSLYASVREARLRLEDWDEQYPGAKYLPVICQNPSVAPPTWKKLQTGGRINGADWDVSSHLTRDKYQKRQILLSKVRNFWVEGVLEKSLHGRVLLELGLEERLDAVNHPWGMVWETPNQLRQTLAPGTRVIDKFDEMAFCRTLLILGEPGSGKTTTLLELARDLINRAEIDINQPIPIVFNLSSWGSEKLKQTIADWLTQELQRSYKVSKKFASSLIKSQKLLLMLDGLDEVKEERRNLCVQALNRFRQDYGEMEIVIASRIRDYERLNYRLDLQSAIYLQPLTKEQINHYFDGVGSTLAAVKNLWQEDEILQELAKSPLMLNIMTLAYEGIKSEDLSIIDSIEERRKHLFDKYIERMFQRRRFKKERYKKEDSMRFLICLANRMSFEKETIFLIERMQPSCLLHKIHKWIYRIGFVLLMGIITALVDFFFSNFTLIFINLQLSPNSLTVSFYYYFFYGLLFGIINLIIGIFRKKEEIMPFETIIVNSNNIKMSFTNGSKNGVIPGIVIGLIIFSLYYLPNIILYSGISLSYFVFFVFFIWTFIGFISFLIMHLFLKKILSDRMYDNIFILTVFIFASLICTLIMQLSPFILIVSWLMAGAICGGLINVIIWGFRVKNLNVTTSVNQGIWNSGITAVLFLVIGGLIGWYIASINSGLNSEQVVITEDFKTIEDFKTYIKTYNNSMLFYQIATIQKFGVILALIPGISVIKHITLRVILYLKKYIPWNYARFLDYATERIFLQKVGGGYIFIHRLLQEHFSSLKLD